MKKDFPPRCWPSGKPIPADMQERMARELEKVKKVRAGKV
jgi:hypothetical protein